MKRTWGIRKKTLVSIAIQTFLLVVFSTLAGSVIFNRAIEKQYNDKGYMIAEMILSEIDHDKVAQYAQTWREDDYYSEMSRYLRMVKNITGAAYIYIMVPYENKTMKYIYDSATFLGDSDPISAAFDEIWKTYTEGERPESYLIRRSKKYGFLTSSCLPVKDSSGNIVALLFVDTNMDVIRSTLFKYVANMIFISLALLVFFIVSSSIYLNKRMINPLIVIKNNVRAFAHNRNLPGDELYSVNTKDELQELARSVFSMENEIVDHIENIKKITADKERISAELNIATKIQADMLPQIFPPFPDRDEFDIYATMTPAKEVGGDFYDFFFVDNDHIALVIADVSGKGVPAALFMVIAKTLVKNRAINEPMRSPSDIIYDVNNQMCQGNDQELFVTMWLCIIELSTGKGMVANAGHEHPVVKRAGGKFELDVYKHSVAIAIFEGVEFTEHEFMLNPGDTLFVYTDGVTEATNEKMELFGTERLLEALNKEPEANTKKLLRNVKDDIDEFVGDAPQFDDITMLGFKYLKKG